MHKRIIKDATDGQVREFATDFLSMLKARDYDLYEEAEWILYRDVYGCHFNEWMLESALEKMHNEDGTTGGHWNLEQTDQVAMQYGIKFDHFNRYDWNYAMNMAYSDYYGAVPNNTESYYKVARMFMMDKDAPDGKALRYYKAMKRAE